MWNRLNETGSDKLQLLFLSGIWTAPGFMEDMRQETASRLQEHGITVNSRLLYPYGDWHRSRWMQLSEAVFDTALGVRYPMISIGGRRVVRSIGHAASADRLVLVGHSAGGISAIHTGAIMKRLGMKMPLGYAQIGSPKVPIPEPIRASVLHLEAVRGETDARSSDPVCRIGSWGGIQRRGVSFRWDRYLRAPKERIRLKIKGGHADYFRRSGAYRDQYGVPNGHRIAHILTEWIMSLMINGIK